jgi:glycosyltransferase involved in cell wall biosynthesis
MRGGEKCLEVFCDLYPDSPIHALFSEAGKVSPAIASHPVKTSFLQNIPGIHKNYRNFLPFFPSAVESFDLTGYDLVISSSHCVAKGVKKAPGAVHVCYCFTPMRYAWGLFDEYFGDKNFLVRALIGAAIGRLRRWDARSSGRVDRFVAISKHIQERIRRAYGRESDVVYPPVDTEFYTPDGTPREDLYLIVSALVPYKKLDLAVKAFTNSGKRLVVIGSGPEEASLKAVAGESVLFLGWRDDDLIRSYYRRARGLIFPGEEDFGIVPVEAQACGCPVVAFARGGALETVIDGRTGVFFEEPTENSLMKAVERLEKTSFSPYVMRANAERFNRERFVREIRWVIDRELSARKAAA